MACNFLYEFPEDLRNAILNNYLANPSGLPGHWVELDLIQEHYNFWIKRLFNSKSHTFDSQHLAEHVGLNIGGFSALRERFPILFGFKRNGGRHTNPKSNGDINRLGFHYRLEHIMSFKPNRRQPYVVGDEFNEGIHKLTGGQLAKFIARTTREWVDLGESVGDGVEVEGARESEQSGAPVVEWSPTNPISSVSGELGLLGFIGTAAE